MNMDKHKSKTKQHELKKMVNNGSNVFATCIANTGSVANTEQYKSVSTVALFTISRYNRISKLF